MTRAILVAVVLVATACASFVDETERSVTGVITGPGRLGLVHLQPGDCIRDQLADEVDALVGVPCNRGHRAQVVSIGTAEEFELDDPAAIDQLCTLPVEEIGRQLLARDDLPQIDVALLYAEDGSRVACILEFAEPITEDLVRRPA
ncbi:MAG: hypothetical protein AAGA90_19560 [Actinomycetota bacterium]